MTSTEARRSKILIVDDDDEIQHLLMTVLCRKGFEVIPARNGEEGCRAFVLFEPDLVLLDLMMPKVDGLSFLRTIGADERSREVPIIVLSAHLQSDPKAALELGATTLLPKPFDTDDLLRLVHNLLSNRSG